MNRISVHARSMRPLHTAISSMRPRHAVGMATKTNSRLARVHDPFGNLFAKAKGLLVSFKDMAKASDEGCMILRRSAVDNDTRRDLSP